MKFSFPDNYRLVPSEIIKARLSRMGLLCREQGLRGLLLTHATDVFYASGTMQQGAVYVDGAGRARVFMRRHPGRAVAESPLCVEPINGLSQVAGELLSVLGPKDRLGVMLDVMSAAEYLAWRERLDQVELVDASGPWLKLQGIKDSWEIKALTAAGQVAAKVFARLPELLKPGVSEAWVTGQMLAHALELGHIDLMRNRGAYMETYSWHLVSGPEGATPGAIDAPFCGYGLGPAFPQGASQKLLRPGEPINVDFGICLEGYQSDQTRTYCLGPAPARVKEAHACLEAVDAALMEALRPGAVSGQLYDLAMDIARQHGMDDVFLGRGRQRIRFVGHGTGLELGTPPYLLEGSQEVVQADEVYCLELKIVLDEGPVGLENTVLVKAAGPAALLTPIPRWLQEIT